MNKGVQTGLVFAAVCVGSLATLLLSDIKKGMNKKILSSFMEGKKQNR